MKAAAGCLVCVSVLAGSIACAGAAAAQGPDETPEGFTREGPAQRVLEPAVTYLPKAPEIDGRLDEALGAILPIREFAYSRRHDDSNPLSAAHYRLGCGAEFLYVYVEAEAEHLTYRDRAYQNGDGSHPDFTDDAAPRKRPRPPQGAAVARERVPVPPHMLTWSDTQCVAPSSNSSGA